jgi:hypothetical protein
MYVGIALKSFLEKLSESSSSSSSMPANCCQRKRACHVRQITCATLDVESSSVQVPSAKASNGRLEKCFLLEQIINYFSGKAS